jgi:lipopolysaccharide transport system permease protein
LVYTPFLIYDESGLDLRLFFHRFFSSGNLFLMPRLIIESGHAERQYWQDLWRYRELFYVLAWRDISVRYKQTVIGVLWAVIQPILITVIFTVVFSKIANMKSEGVPYPLWVFAAMLPWQFFAASLAAASQSLVMNSNLISKVYFPRMIVPAGAVVTSMVDFLITFGIFLLMAAWYHVWPTWRFIAVPFLMLLAFVSALGPGLLITALNVKYRDFRYIIPFIIQIGIYVSPVPYSSSVVEQKLPIWMTWLYSLNPMVGVIDGFRWALLDGKGGISLLSFTQSLSVTVFLAILGLWYFRKTERTFADII